MTTLGIEKALFDYLSTDANLTSLGNPPLETRIYPMRLPEGTILPAISYFKVGAQRVYTYDPFEDTNAFVKVRVQFNCWSTKPDEAMTIGEGVLLALSGYDGEMGGELLASSFAVLEQDHYEPESKMYRRLLDFQILYEENLAPSS